MCIMLNFLELGADVLKIDDTWFIPAVVRPKWSEKLDGGWSHLLRLFGACCLVH